jgi:hypothetical protein
MADPLTLLATLFCGAGSLAILGFGILYVTKGAIATAVAQAGAREIERLKGELAKELERERQAFARELERERCEAGTALERFKTELTFEAEVRRQVAGKKVEALLAIFTVSDALVGRVFWAAGPKAAIEALEEYVGVLREALPFLDDKQFEEMNAYAETVAASLVASKKDTDAEAFGRAQAKAKEILDLVRRELLTLTAGEGRREQGRST